MKNDWKKKINKSNTSSPQKSISNSLKFLYFSHLNHFKNNWYTSIQNYWRFFQYTITFSRYLLRFSFSFDSITCQIFTCLKILSQNHQSIVVVVKKQYLKIFAIRLISMRRKRERVITVEARCDRCDAGHGNHTMLVIEPSNRIARAHSRESASYKHTDLQPENNIFPNANKRMLRFVIASNTRNIS